MSNESVTLNVTLVIKTFQRPESCERLYATIRRYYPEISIIIIDDGNIHPTIDLELDRNVQVINLPFDTGVSAGRNAGLNQVRTKYFVTLDDDFVFTHQTKLENWFTLLENNEDIDLVGGRVEKCKPYHGTWVRIDAETIELRVGHAKGKSQSGLLLYDITLQFFMARTHVIRRVQWDPELKMVDHSVFFHRCKNANVVVTLDESVVVDHYHTDPGDYKSFRQREEFRSMSMTKMGVSVYNIKHKSLKQYKFVSCLLSAKTLLDALKIPFNVSCGTALGLRREGQFIEHDMDIDLEISCEQLDLHIADFFIQGGNFKLYNVLKYKDYITELSLIHLETQVKLDIFVQYQHDAQHVFNVLWDLKRTPELPMGNPVLLYYKNYTISSVVIDGVNDVLCPDSNYLEQNYGPQWMIPIDYQKEAGKGDAYKLSLNTKYRPCMLDDVKSSKILDDTLKNGYVNKIHRVDNEIQGHADLTPDNSLSVTKTCKKCNRPKTVRGT